MEGPVVGEQIGRSAGGQPLERFGPRGRRREAIFGAREHVGEREQIFRAIVDQEQIDRVLVGGSGHDHSAGKLSALD